MFNSTGCLVAGTTRIFDRKDKPAKWWPCGQLEILTFLSKTHYTDDYRASNSPNVTRQPNILEHLPCCISVEDIKINHVRTSTLNSDHFHDISAGKHLFQREQHKHEALKSIYSPAQVSKILYQLKRTYVFSYRPSSS
jgi:hypothetical protein